MKWGYKNKLKSKKEEENLFNFFDEKSKDNTKKV